MRSKSGSGNQLEPDPHFIQPNTVFAEPWWRNIGYNPISPSMTWENISNSSSLECPNGGSESNECQSPSERLNEESQTTASPRSVGNYGQDQRNTRNVASTAPKLHGECLAQPPQLELVGHSIACASNPYQDPYYSGMVAAYGHQPLGYSPFAGMSHARMPLPHELAQETVYVNAKQYQGIMRQRQKRAKAELERKLIKARKPYLHESRHQHALRRARASGGRFAKKTNIDASNCTAEKKGTDPVLSSHSCSSSGSELLPSDSAETWYSSNSQLEAKGSQVHNIHNYVNGGSHCQNNGRLQASTHHSHCGERGEEGDYSGQQPGSIASNHTSEASCHPVNTWVGGGCQDGEKDPTNRKE